MKPLKQKNTNIKFTEFKEVFPDEEVISYQAMIRYLTLLEYKFFELRKPDGYYICTTTSMYCLNKKSKLFSRVNEIANANPLDERKLTYYELHKNDLKNDDRIPREKFTKRPDGSLKSSRIPDDIILLIRESTEPLSAIGKQFGIAKSTAFNIRKRYIYTHI